MRAALEAALQQPVQVLQKAYDEASGHWATGQTALFPQDLTKIKEAMTAYDNATAHVRVHAKPKTEKSAKGKAKGKAKAKA
jgi:hypothetical protein